MPRDRATDERDRHDAGFHHKTCAECFEPFWTKDDTQDECYACQLAHAVIENYYEDTPNAIMCRFCAGDIIQSAPGVIVAEHHSKRCAVLLARAHLGEVMEMP